MISFDDQIRAIIQRLVADFNQVRRDMPDATVHQECADEAATLVFEEVMNLTGSALIALRWQAEFRAILEAK